MWEILGLIGGLLVAVALMLMIVATRYASTKYLIPASVSYLLGMMFVFAYAIQCGLWPVWIPIIVQVAVAALLAVELSEAAKRARLARSPPGIDAVMWNMAAHMDDKDQMTPREGPHAGVSPASSETYKDSVRLLSTPAPAPDTAAPIPPVASLREMFLEHAEIAAQASQHLSPTPDSAEPSTTKLLPDARENNDAVVVTKETTSARDNNKDDTMVNPLAVLDAPFPRCAPPSPSSASSTAAPRANVVAGPCQSPEPSLDLTTDPPAELPAELALELPMEPPEQLQTEPPTKLITEQPIEVATELTTELPTELATDLPTELPTELTTELPTELATDLPVELPTELTTEPPTELAMDLPTELPTDSQAGPISVATSPLEGLSTIKSNPQWLQDMQKSRADLQSMLQRVSGLLHETESNLNVNSRAGTPPPSADAIAPHRHYSPAASRPSAATIAEAAPSPDQDAHRHSKFSPSTLVGEDPTARAASPPSLPEASPPSAASCALSPRRRAAAVLEPELDSQGGLPPRPAAAASSAPPPPPSRPVLPPLPLGSGASWPAETTPRDQMLASNRSTDEFFTPLATLRQPRTPREVTPRLLGPILSVAGASPEVPEVALVMAEAAEAADVATAAASVPETSVPASPTALAAGRLDQGALPVVEEEEVAHQGTDDAAAWGSELAAAAELVGLEPPESKPEVVKRTTEIIRNSEAIPCLDMGILTPPEMSGSSGGGSEARRHEVVSEQEPARLAEASAAEVPGWSVASSTPRDTSRTGVSSPRSLGPSPLRSVLSYQDSSGYPEEATAARRSPASPQDWARVFASPESQSTFGTQQSAAVAQRTGPAFQMPRLPLAEIPSGALCGHLYNHQVSVRVRQAAVPLGGGTQRSYAAATQRSSQRTGITLDDSDAQTTRHTEREGTDVGTPEAKSGGRLCPSERSATSAPWLGHGCESMAGSSLMYPSEQASPGESVPQESERLRVEAILALKQSSPQHSEAYEPNPQPTDRCAQPSVSGRTSYLLDKLFSGINLRWDSKESEVRREGVDVENASLASNPMPEAPLDSHAISVSHIDPDVRATPTTSEPELSGMTSNYAPSVDSYMNTPNLHIPAQAAVPGQLSSPGDDACTSAPKPGRVQSAGRRRAAPGGSVESGPPIVRGWNAVNRHNSAGAGRLRKGKMSDISPTISRDAMQRALGKGPGADAPRPHHPPSKFAQENIRDRANINHKPSEESPPVLYMSFSSPFSERDGAR